MNTQIKPIVVTGSAAQVPKDVATQLGIEILPLKIFVNGKEYQDGIDISPGDLYLKMRSEVVEVKTAAPGVGQYYECFNRFADGGGREILCITLSSKLSSDYNAAVDAAEMIRADHRQCEVTVFDSLRAAAPQGQLTVEAARRLRAGESIQEIVRYLSEARYRSGLIAALDSLEYLARGGADRQSGLSGWQRAANRPDS